MSLQKRYTYGALLWILLVPFDFSQASSRCEGVFAREMPQEVRWTESSESDWELLSFSEKLGHLKSAFSRENEAPIEWVESFLQTFTWSEMGLVAKELAPDYVRYRKRKINARAWSGAPIYHSYYHPLFMEYYHPPR